MSDLNARVGRAYSKCQGEWHEWTVERRIYDASGYPFASILRCKGCGALVESRVLFPLEGPEDRPSFTLTP